LHFEFVYVNLVFKTFSTFDAPPNSLIDSTASSNVKTTEGILWG